MPKPKTTKTLTFEVSVKVALDAKPRDIAAHIRGELENRVNSVRVKQVKED